MPATGRKFIYLSYFISLLIPFFSFQFFIPWEVLKTVMQHSVGYSYK